ncbi:MAG: peptidase M28 [Acidobacteria bacterium RIFCSPLOWO2_02_FULL_67_36]|nr:MAG: peptidase M28 [Acidobacteria bacterium RIFCSPLOWO2_02_FULL_67_36]
MSLLVALVALVLQDPAAEGRRWWSHIELLASDSLEGRNVGTPGFEKAAAYVEAQFKSIGLTPGGSSGFRQPVKLESRVLVPDQSKLALVRDGVEQPLAIGEDASLSARGELDGSIEAPMVFIGYGLSIPEAKWDDLAGQDLRGKIAVYSSARAPVEVSDNVRSHVSSVGERWAVLKRAGAIGMATLPNPPAGTASSESAAGAPRGAAPGRGRGSGSASASAPQPIVVLADRALQDQGGQLVSMTITRRGAEKVLAGSGHAIEELHQLIADKKPLPHFALAGTLRAQARVTREPVDSTNIVGIHEGTGPQLKSEYVVMSAHLDHVGVGRAVNGDAIYNGAMDDASGIASLVEVARLLKESGARPKRSIAFVAVTAEEKGLLGSKYFAAHPTVPFDKIVADINLDMFLPLYPLKVIEVQGLTESSLGDTVRASAKALGVEVQTDREPDQNRFIRSDQYSFIRRGIPSLAFKFGYEFGSPEEKIRRDWVRDVYHKPNDDAKQTVDVESAARFNHVILGLLQRVANDRARPRWNDDSFFKRFAK